MEASLNMIKELLMIGGVYLTRPSISKYAPKDFQYFQRLVDYGTKYGFDNLYEDYVEIYNLTTKNIEETVLRRIKRNY